ncbi:MULTISPECIES: hypothetical protein [unclassified Endozoicomonas]|uniref:hypothetical protein n=1 Tax=unclassified Endozoicomonas TaxID=2644528 RepID=UPI003BB1D72E
MIRQYFHISWSNCIVVNLFGLALLLLLFKAQASTFNPSIFWMASNFSKNENKTLFVRSESIVYFICDNTHLFLKRTTGFKTDNDLYDNLWLVDKADYEQCKVDASKPTSWPLKTCRKPLHFSSHREVFREYGTGKPVYLPGHIYYYISTANGSESSLNSLEGGHCRSHNMRLAVYICKTYGPECINEKTETTTHPVITTYPEPTTYSETSNYTETTNHTETGNYSEATTYPVVKTYPTTVPTTHSHSIKQPFELVWNVRYNESQNLYIYKESDFPIVAFCEANSVITRLGDEGEVVNSWPCQSGVHHLVILKPKYNNGDVYVFEAFPEQGSVQVLKSILTVNIASEGNLEYLVSDAIPSTGKPAFAFLISVYLLTASAW